MLYATGNYSYAHQFPFCYETLKFIAIITKSCCCLLTLASWIQFTSPCSVCLIHSVKLPTKSVNYYCFVCYISIAFKYWLSCPNNMRWNVKMIRPLTSWWVQLFNAAWQFVTNFSESHPDVAVIRYEHVLRPSLQMTYFILLLRTAENLKARIKWNVFLYSTYWHKEFWMKWN
jgi:hypothetical protein